jgi:hypothetical protein
MRTVLRNTRAQDVGQLEEDIGIARLYESLVELREATDPFIDQLKTMKDEFDSISGKAQALGLDGTLLAQGVRANVNKQLDDALLGIVDPLRLSLQNEEVFARRLLELVRTLGADELKAQQLIAARRMQLLREEAEKVRQMLDISRASNSSSTLLGALRSVVDSLDDVARSLRDQVTGLRQGPLSPLTPEQKLMEARDEFMRLVPLALGGDMDALAKVGEAGNTLLEFSREYFASSEGYQNDFALVTATLEDIADFAETRKTEGEQVIALLEIHQSLLEAIEFNLSSESPNYELLKQQERALALIDQRIGEANATSNILQLAEKEAVEHLGYLSSVGNELINAMYGAGIVAHRELIDVLTGKNLELGTIAAVRESSQAIVSKLNEFQANGLPVYQVQSGSSEVITQLQQQLADAQAQISSLQQQLASAGTGGGGGGVLPVEQADEGQIATFLQWLQLSSGGDGYFNPTTTQPFISEASRREFQRRFGYGFPEYAAMGAAYGPSGAVRYAYGGVVTSPTMFGTGDGTMGVMGEAGFEAIMPLSRGPDGRLGVAVVGAGNDNDELIAELRAHRVQQAREQEQLHRDLCEVRAEQRRLSNALERATASGVAFGGRV